MSVIQTSLNHYYIHIRRDRQPIPWDIYDPNLPIPLGSGTYISQVFQAMEKSLKVKDLVFYITWDELEELPSYGENVVVVVIGDEWYRIPKYFNKVMAVFKCVGVRPILGCNPLLQPSHLNLLTLIQFLRISVVRLPGVYNYYFHKFKNSLLGKAKIPPIYEIPLGYNNSKDLPVKNLEDRLYNTFFSGSVQHIPYPIWSVKYWLGTPKLLSRKQMISSLKEFQEKQPDMKVELSITSSYHNRSTEDESNYVTTMMDTKICLVPRGTSWETTRLFEAMKYGCILVAEALPPRWYLDGSPVIKIGNWRDLEKIMSQLLNNKEQMEEIHKQSLNWWNTKCSETVVGTYIAEQLNALSIAS